MSNIKNIMVLNRNIVGLNNNNNYEGIFKVNNITLTSFLLSYV